MDFIQYTLKWCRGEIFMGKLFALFGVIVLILAIFYWVFGATSSAKALIIPFLVLGFFCTSGGLGIVYTNRQRIVTFQNVYDADEVGFVQSEKARTEQVLKGYPRTMWGMAGIVLIGLCCFLIWAGPYGRAVGLTLMLFGFSILFMDHFSEERVRQYHHLIVNCPPSAKATDSAPTDGWDG